MRTLVLLLASVALAHAAPLPQPKVGSCPSGYSQSGVSAIRCDPTLPPRSPSKASVHQADAVRRLLPGDATALARAIHKSRLSR
jgi:hypothetical protein